MIVMPSVNATQAESPRRSMIGAGAVRQQTAAGSCEAAVSRWYREMIQAVHPDRGGSTEAAQAINRAHDRLRQLLGLDVISREA